MRSCQRCCKASDDPVEEDDVSAKVFLQCFAFSDRHKLPTAMTSCFEVLRVSESLCTSGKSDGRVATKVGRKAFFFQAKKGFEQQGTAGSSDVAHRQLTMAKVGQR